MNEDEEIAKKECEEWCTKNELVLQTEDEYILRKSVKKFVDSFGHKELVWKNLAMIAVDRNNLYLALLCVSHLKIVRVATLMRSVIDLDSKKRCNQLYALSILASHLDMDEAATKLVEMSTRLRDPDQTIISLNPEIEYHLNHINWSRALELAATDTKYAKLNKNRLHIEFAKFSECDEDIETALKEFKECGLEKEHKTRLILKQASVGILGSCQLNDVMQQTNEVILDNNNDSGKRRALFTIKLSSNLDEHHSLQDNLIKYCFENKRIKSSEKKRYLFHTYLQIGLCDEAMQVFALASYNSEDVDIDKGVVFLESTLSESYNDTLERIDPCIEVKTLRAIKRCQTKNQANSTAVITSIVLIITLSIRKLTEVVDAISDSSSHIKSLELSFSYLATYLREFNYNTHESLLRAIVLLTDAVKSKLEVLADNELIKDNFNFVAQSTASRFMVQGQYRNAAKLYTLIEDNLNAAKALMRVGDINVVISFALMIRDMAVNRLTLNYLKHLQVSQDVIQDFVNKTSDI